MRGSIMCFDITVLVVGLLIELLTPSVVISFQQ